MKTKKKDYLRWAEYFMKIAELSALRSKDPKLQVGAVFVDPKTNHILGIGYNGLPRGFSDDTFNWEKCENFIENKLNYIVHAEPNAILNSTTKDLRGADLYVTMFPCNECAKLLSQVGIGRIFYKDGRYLEKDTGKVAKTILDHAGVKCYQYNEYEMYSIVPYRPKNGEDVYYLTRSNFTDEISGYAKGKCEGYDMIIQGEDFQTACKEEYCFREEFQAQKALEKMRGDTE